MGWKFSTFNNDIFGVEMGLNKRNGSEIEINSRVPVLEVCKSDPKPIRIRSDRIRSDFGTKIFISDRIDKVVS
jgi:hypothetical protein